MKSKKEFLILGIVIALLVAYLVMQKSDRTHYELPEIADISESDITTLQIATADVTIELKKEHDQWLIFPEKFPADPETINPMLDVVKTLTVTDLISEAKSYERYELDDKKKINIQALSGKKLVRAFDIGKTAPSYKHTFVKLADDDRIYNAKENFRNKFEKSKDDLRNKTVLEVDKSKIHQIEITREETTMALSLVDSSVNVDITKDGEEKEDKEKPANDGKPKIFWQNADGTPANETDINGLFTAVSKLACNKYITDRKKEDFTSPLYTLTMHGPKTQTLSIFKKENEDDSDYPAISSDNDYPFLLTQYKADDIMKKLKKEEAAPDK